MSLFIKGKTSILFLHVPKCGGSSISELFRRMGFSITLEMRGLPAQECLIAPQHQICENLKSILNFNKLNSVFIVTRNPYDRIVSEFNWQFRSVEPSDRPDINLWIIESLERASINCSHADNHFRPAIDFLDEDIPCHIFKLEDRIELIAEFFTEYNNSPETLGIPNEKDSKNFNYTTAKTKLNNSSINAINTYYQHDFLAFDYKKIDIPYDSNSTKTLQKANNNDQAMKEKAKKIISWRENTLEKLLKKIHHKLPTNHNIIKNEEQERLKPEERQVLSSILYENLTLDLNYLKAKLNTGSIHATRLSIENLWEIYHLQKAYYRIHRQQNRR